VVIVTFTTQQQPPAAHGHDHAVGLEETFDFLNTLEYEAGSPVDHLATPADAVAWLVDHGLAHREAADRVLVRYTADARVGSRDLARLRKVRAALREVADAVVERRPASDEAVAEVNRALHDRPIAQLIPTASGVTVGHGHAGHPFDDSLARLAEPLVREIATGDPDRLRVCANDQCRWVFYDTSPTGRRRWCDMATCGNRAKAARHRARTKGSA
jgi:predicted RNA-binding Zn ribbon-like protein